MFLKGKKYNNVILIPWQYDIVSHCILGVNKILCSLKWLNMHSPIMCVLYYKKCFAFHVYEPCYALHCMFVPELLHILQIWHVSISKLSQHPVLVAYAHFPIRK